MLAILPGDPSLVRSKPHTGSSECIMPAPEDPGPSPGLCRHLHIHSSHSCRNTHIYMNKMKKISLLKN